MPADHNDGCPAPQWAHLQEQGLVARWETTGRVLYGYAPDGGLVFMDLDYTLITEAHTLPTVRAFEGLARVPETRLWRRAA